MSRSFLRKGHILLGAIVCFLLILSFQKPLEPLVFTTYDQFLTELASAPADQWVLSGFDIPPVHHAQRNHLLSQGTKVEAWADWSTYHPFEKATGVDDIYASSFLYDTQNHTTFRLYEIEDGCHLMVTVPYKLNFWESIYCRIRTDQPRYRSATLYHLATLPSGTIQALHQLTFPPVPQPLTADELDFFNNNSFFDNGTWNGMNIRNQFLTSFYDDPKDVNLFNLFYCGTGLEERTCGETQEILDDIIASVPFYPDAGCNIVTTDEMNRVLTEHLNLTLEESNKVGLETMSYLPQRDLYFHFHGDTNYGHMVHFTSGEQQGNTFYLYYRDTFGLLNFRNCVLTLQKEGDNYLFLSNQPLSTN